MKQTVEEAAMQELMSSYAIVVEGELVYQRQAMLNMFRKVLNGGQGSLRG